MVKGCGREMLSSPEGVLTFWSVQLSGRQKNGRFVEADG